MTDEPHSHTWQLPPTGSGLATFKGTCSGCAATKVFPGHFEFGEHGYQPLPKPTRLYPYQRDILPTALVPRRTEFHR